MPFTKLVLFHKMKHAETSSKVLIYLKVVFRCSHQSDQWMERHPDEFHLHNCKTANWWDMKAAVWCLIILGEGRTSQRGGIRQMWLSMNGTQTATLIIHRHRPVRFTWKNPNLGPAHNHFCHGATGTSGWSFVLYERLIYTWWWS